MICTPEDELHKFHNTIYGNALDNPVTGRGGNVDIIAMTCELAQVVVA